MSTNRIFSIFLILLVSDQIDSEIIVINKHPDWNPFEHHEFYVPGNQVEVINASAFETVLDSNYLNVVKFYAHDDDESWYFVPRYVKFALETQLWHSTVLRVLAIDCFDDKQVTEQLCRENGAKFIYPQLKFYTPFQTTEIGLTAPEREFKTFDIDKSSDEDLLRICIYLIEQQDPKPDDWPSLKAYQ
jgi:hypothetical protein